MDENYEIALNLILHAGNSKSYSVTAIQKAKQFQFAEAEKELTNARKELTSAHQIQTELLHAEASGSGLQPNLIVIHAQDHLTMALISLENAEELIQVYTVINRLKNKEDIEDGTL